MSEQREKVIYFRDKYVEELLGRIEVLHKEKHEAKQKADAATTRFSDTVGHLRLALEVLFEPEKYGNIEAAKAELRAVHEKFKVLNKRAAKRTHESATIANPHEAIAKAMLLD